MSAQIAPEIWSRILAGKIPPTAVPREPLSVEAGEVDRINQILSNMELKWRGVDDAVADLIAATKQMAVQVIAETHKARSRRQLGTPYYPDDGTFTVMEIVPRIFSSSLATPFNTWDFTVNAGWNFLYGTDTDPIEGSDVDNQRKQFLILGILVKRGPVPKAFTMGVGDIKYNKPFIPITVNNPTKPWTLLILPNPVYIHFKGKFYLRALFDRSGSGWYEPIGYMSVDAELLTEANFWS